VCSCDVWAKNVNVNLYSALSHSASNALNALNTAEIMGQS